MGNINNRIKSCKTCIDNYKGLIFLWIWNDKEWTNKCDFDSIWKSNDFDIDRVKEISWVIPCARKRQCFIKSKQYCLSFLRNSSMRKVCYEFM